MEIPFVRREPHLIEGLVDLIDLLPGGRMAEIGCFQGESTFLFAQKFSIIAIDAWDMVDYPFETSDRLRLAEQTFRTKARLFPGIRIMKSLSVAASASVPDQSLDFVYIDAGHCYAEVVADIRAWLPKVKKNGYIGGHDYDEPLCPEVRAAVDSFFKVQVFKDTSWLARI